MAEYSEFAEQEADSQEIAGINSEYSAIAMPGGISKRYPLGIISDTGYISGKFIRKFLDKEGLLHYFKSLIFSDEQTYCKPHPSVFELTSNKLQVDPAMMIHIGDLEKTDIIGAKKSGWTSIKFIGASSDSVSGSKADYTIDHFNLFPQLLDSIHKR